MNGDLGGITMSGDDPASTLESARGCLVHFHASEPNLVELGASADHAAAASGLAAADYRGWIAIEMRAARSANVSAVERAVRLVRSVYGEALA